MLTMSSAVQLAKYGINVNAIAPGTIDTDLARSALEPEKLAKFGQVRIPIGRLGQPQDLVGAVVFLCSDASDYVLGHTLVVDGGWTLFGSANWDPRSLRLNFEFNVECYDVGFSSEMEALFAKKRDAGRRVSAEELDGRSLPARLRDGMARLLSPYL